MKLKYLYILLSILIGIIFLLIICYFFIGKYKTGVILDKLNFTHDVYNINIDTSIIQDTYIYWYGENDLGRSEEYSNRILLFKGSQLATIPPNYGDNTLVVCYKNTCYNKIGISKVYAYSKHNYNISVSKVDSLLLIDWEIKNWYDPYVLQGNDTIKIK